jgi:hypothetical protein
MPCPISPAPMTAIFALLIVQLSNSDRRAIDNGAACDYPAV